MRIPLPDFSLLPVLCVFCNQQGTSSGLCEGCRNDLPRCGPSCRYCAEPLPAPLDVPCARCQARRPPWQRCVAALPYAWPVDHALKALKFSRRLAFAAAFGGMLLPILKREFAHCDALCPVPLHRWRHAVRGFNQAAEICRPLARATGLPVIRSIRRVRYTVAQTGLGRRERSQNLRGAFRSPAKLDSRHPLLVDDVMTTGETCRALAMLLKRAGAEEVSVLVVARAAGSPQAGAALLKV